MSRPVARSTTSPGGAVVLGASYRALAIVRSLGRAGVRVVVVRTDEHELAASSRYARRCTIRLEGGDGTRRDTLLGLAARDGLSGWALIPTSDEDAALVAREHVALSRRYTLTTPPWPILRLAYDKRQTHTLATRHGLAQPWTTVPAESGGPASVAPPFPAILKPALKADHNALTAAKAWRVNGPEELARRWTEACRMVDPGILMVQELIVGGQQLSFAALCRDGEVLAELTARRARQHPVDFGRASTFVETIEDPRVGRDARALLSAMRFTGLVEVEYVRDPRTGDNLLLDVNPRPWGWQSLGGPAGVDFPVLLWRMVSGEPVPALRAVPGVRWVRLLMDIPAAGQEWRRGTLSVREWVRSLHGPIQGAVYARDDPLPALVDVGLLVRIAGARLLRGEAV
jgi:D-aspartate ligase